MIAIIGAMKSEIDGLTALLQNKKTDTRLANVIAGTIFGKDVVLCVCGIGKVYAAAAAAFIAAEYSPEQMINVGVAGGAGQGVKKLDVVVSDRVIQHDFDLTAGGLKKGQMVEGHDGYLHCDENICRRLFDLANSATAGGSTAHGSTAHRGVIVTGDKFVASTEEAAQLARDFSALACDMESAAIAQVADMFGIRFASMRSVSDGADDTAAMDFDEFLSRAAEVSIGILAQYLREIE